MGEISYLVIQVFSVSIQLLKNLITLVKLEIFLKISPVVALACFARSIFFTNLLLFESN